MTILDAIAVYKREEIARAKHEMPESMLDEQARTAGPPRGFRAALAACRDAGYYGLIAEIKRASPSKGLIRADFDPGTIARAYRDGGAACLSVLTDGPSFQGAPAHLETAHAAVTLPVLRKDFLFDPYQIVQSRALGADCILIILAAVDDDDARALLAAARHWGMDALVEIHDEIERDRALALGAEMIGINNRDLKTFVTDPAVTLRLAPAIPRHVLVIGESGLSSPSDLRRLADAGVTTFLIGESLMREKNIAAATRALLRDSEYSALRKKGSRGDGEVLNRQGAKTPRRT
ncbi:MAG TPA: indole-3-glycerol phosphate synthase TrpC [Rhizomicrobium sp.]|nr:indole-3-glycerol phosphate synthase TrpC [Rhizomicrobium sp.]